jgi:1-deoxy-D-xylulose-5-phosphate reductoisomerase
LKNLVILGSSGSIGKNTLWVADRFPEELKVYGLAVHSNIDELKRQIIKYRPAIVAVADEQAALKFARKAAELGVEFLSGESGLEQLASAPDAQIILNGVVGAAGLKSTLAAAGAGKRIALANKESMVAGGELVNKMAKNANAEIIPVDSEHSAIFQCLKAGTAADVRRLILTSSGGPFRRLAIENFRGITVEQALQHPTWNMGRKITIDSATLMNKGLEIIEVVYLFGMPVSKVDVVIHPQSIVHSMVEFDDGAIIAQLSKPDMRLPIQFALFYPERKELNVADLDFSKLQELNFEAPDETKFPSLKLAREAIRTGGTAPAALNAANEVAVESFLSKRLSFPGIFATVEYVLEKSRSRPYDSLDSIIAADKEARELARQYVRLQSI